MTAVAIRLRAEFRARWQSWMGVALIAGVLGGLVLAAFAAAERAESALDRLLEGKHPQDVHIAKGFVFQNFDLDFDRIERLPQVARVARDRPLAALIRTNSGEQMYGGHEESVIPLASPDGSQLRALNRPKLLAGRLPDPRSRDEILVDEKALDILGLKVGDTVRVRFIWRRLLGTDKVDFSADPERARVGPLAELRIVGEMARPGSDDWSGELRVPPGVYRANGGAALGSFQEILNVQLRRGEADIPAFRAAVDRIAGRRDFFFAPTAADRTKLQRSIDLEARALRVAGAFGALAVLILLAQALMRQAHHAAADYPTLRALGMSRAQLILVGLGRAGLVAAVVATVAVLVAVALSSLAPIGRARSLEPRPGIDFDGPVLAAGAALIFLAALAAGALAAARTALAAGAPSSPVSIGARAGTLTPIGLPPAMLAGIRLAFARGPGTQGAAAGTILAGAIAAVAVAAAALTFSASLGKLLTTPSLYGQSWDYEAPFDPRDVPKLRDRGRIPGLPPGRWLSGAAVGASSRLEVGGKLVGVHAYDDVKGRVPPTVVEGRAPTRPGEILLARKTLDALDLQIGDSVEIRRGARAAAMRVVGLGVVPEGEWVKFGEGAALTFEGFKRVVPDAILFQVHLNVASGEEHEAGMTRLERQYDWPGPARPSSIGDFGGIQGLPTILAALLALTAAAALAHALVTSVRRRRRELAILKTLGFVRGQILAAVTWQATALAAIGLLVGLPLGVAAGRFVWNVFAEDLGVLPEPVVPAGWTLLIVPATLLIAVLIAAIPGRMAARTQPALILRTE
jgi:FtsX-like permease family